jgi:hypothetical protein
MLVLIYRSGSVLLLHINQVGQLKFTVAVNNMTEAIASKMEGTLSRSLNFADALKRGSVEEGKFG